MTPAERRKSQQPYWAIERWLNDVQLVMLRELERFGWELKYLRRPPFQAPVPIIFDDDRKAYAVLESDGTVNEHPNIAVRD